MKLNNQFLHNVLFAQLIHFLYLDSFTVLSSSEENIGMARVLLKPNMRVCSWHTDPFSTNTEPVLLLFLELQNKWNESYSTARRASVDDTISIRTVRLQTCGNGRLVHWMAPRFGEAWMRLVQEPELIRWNRRRRAPHQPGSAWTEDLSVVRRKSYHPPASDS